MTLNNLNFWPQALFYTAASMCDIQGWHVDTIVYAASLYKLCLWEDSQKPTMQRSQGSTKAICI